MKVSELIRDLHVILTIEGDMNVEVKDWDFIEHKFGLSVERGTAFIDLTHND